jgi:hypothetical protein
MLEWLSLYGWRPFLSRSASAEGPFGGLPGVAIAPERMMTGEVGPPLDREQIPKKSFGRLQVIVAPRRHGPLWRYASDPCSARGLRLAHELAALRRQFTQVGDSGVKFHVLCALQKSGKEVFYVGT